MDGVDGGGSGGGGGGSSASDPLATVSSEGSGGGASGGGATAIPAVSTVYVTIPQAGTIVSGGSKSVSTPLSTPQHTTLCLSVPPILSIHSRKHSSHFTSLPLPQTFSLFAPAPLPHSPLFFSLVFLDNFPFGPPLLPTLFIQLYPPCVTSRHSSPPHSPSPYTCRLWATCLFLRLLLAASPLPLPPRGFLPLAHVVSWIPPVSRVSPVYPCICHPATPVLSVLAPHSSSDPLPPLQLYSIPTIVPCLAHLLTFLSFPRNDILIRTYKSVNHRAAHTWLLR